MFPHFPNWWWLGLGLHWPLLNRNAPTIWMWSSHTKLHIKELHLSMLVSTQTQWERRKCQQVSLASWCLGVWGWNFKAYNSAWRDRGSNQCESKKERATRDRIPTDIWQFVKCFWELHLNNTKNGQGLRSAIALNCNHLLSCLLKSIVLEPTSRKSNNLEERHVCWTTYFNIKSWFDYWERSLLGLGFAKVVALVDCDT